jgi:hypothetical protein
MRVQIDMKDTGAFGRQVMVEWRQKGIRGT